MKCQQCGKEYPHKKGRFCGYCYPPKPEKDGLKVAVNALIVISDSGESYGYGRCQCDKCNACIAHRTLKQLVQMGVKL